MLCIISSTSPSVSPAVPPRFRNDREGIDEENNEIVCQVPRPRYILLIIWLHKQYTSFWCYIHDTFAKCLDSKRDGVSHEAVGKDISSSKTEDSQEWKYQGQGGCFASWGLSLRRIYLGYLLEHFNLPHLNHYICLTCWAAKPYWLPYAFICRKLPS